MVASIRALPVGSPTVLRSRCLTLIAIKYAFRNVWGELIMKRGRIERELCFLTIWL